MLLINIAYDILMLKVLVHVIGMLNNIMYQSLGGKHYHIQK